MIDISGEGNFSIIGGGIAGGMSDHGSFIGGSHNNQGDNSLLHNEIV